MTATTLSVVSTTVSGIKKNRNNCPVSQAELDELDKLESKFFRTRYAAIVAEKRFSDKLRELLARF